MNDAKRSLLDLRLYLVLDPTFLLRNDFERTLTDAVKGGVTIVQIREKNCSDEEFAQLAFKASRILRELNIPLIINDRVDVAMKVEAQGVHLGQSDIHWSYARKLLGENAIIGLSVENLGQARQAKNAGIDYLGVSAVFPTATKKDLAHVWGLEGVKLLRSETCLPLVGIGGIDKSNIQSVIDAGADGSAVVKSICSSSQPFKSSRQLRQLIEQAAFKRSGVNK